MNNAKLANIYASHLVDNDSLSDSAHDRLDRQVLNHRRYPGPWNETIEKLAHPALVAVI